MNSDNSKFNYAYPATTYSTYPTYPTYYPKITEPENPPNYISSTNFPSSTNTKAERLAKFDALVRKYEINPEYAIKLRQLEGFEIVVICDDSGSMNSPVSNPTTKDHMNLPTRWEELKSTVKTIVEIAGTLDRTGVDVYFLNRPGVKNVSDFTMVEPHFATEPEGYTPIVQTFIQVLNDMHKVLSEKKLLIILATDGEPTTAGGQTSSQGMTEKQRFYNLLKTRQPIDKIYTSILACTDDDSVISYLQDWDTQIPNLDVVDDFHTVKSNVVKKQGSNYHFSFGDYIVKTLLGSIDKFFDEIDEVEDEAKKFSCTIS
jgi:hypothetical protein